MNSILRYVTTRDTGLTEHPAGKLCLWCDVELLVESLRIDLDYANIVIRKMGEAADAERQRLVAEVERLKKKCGEA